ncbi:MAG: rhodanese-like domain-containing protein, partial [Pseudomonadota bacterium]|nr:rhodanese-like domain-containing protein [Pseudomonadota bacterium]
HVVVCHHGIRSRMVAKHLIGIGFEKVINLSTGVEGWANDVDSTMNKYA